MTIKVQAYLRGYMHEKMASEPVTLFEAPADKVDARNQYQAAEAKRKRPTAKAVREKRYTDQFNKDVMDYTKPTKQYPGYESPAEARDRLVRKGQAEASRHREAGTTPKHNEWNRLPWQLLGVPKAKGTAGKTSWDALGTAATKAEIQEARDAIGKPAPAPVIDKHRTPKTTADYEKIWKSRGF